MKVNLHRNIHKRISMRTSARRSCYLKPAALVTDHGGDSALISPHDLVMQGRKPTIHLHNG